MKKMILTLCLLGVFSFSFSQAEEDYHKGRIFKEDGTSEDGIIEADLKYPWIIQKYIRFFDAALLNQEDRVKLRDKPKIDPKDIAGFEFEGKRYESNKYADLSGLGPGSLGTFYFLELVEDGPIKLYKYYNSPPTVMQGEPEGIYEDLRNSPTILYRKGDTKLQPISSVTLEEAIKDCPEVKAKFDKGDYGNKLESNPDDAKKSRLGKLIKSVTTAQPNLNDYVFEVVREYNTLMSKQ